MAKGNQFEKQATYSLYLSIASTLLVIGGVAVMLRNFDFRNMEYHYTSGGKGLLVVLGSIGFSWVCGVVGCYLGFVSAGHKRNALSNTSWIGFGVGAVATTLAMCAFIVVFLLRERVG